jgi:hypothetical protein
MAPIDSLERCIFGLHVEEIETDSAGFRALGPDPMPPRLLGILGHQPLEFRLGILVLQKGRPGLPKEPGELGPGIGRTHVDGALLRWNALDLATASKVGVATIRRAEVVDGEIPVTLANEAALRQALEAAGVDFIEDNGGGEGVRFRKPQGTPKKKRSQRDVTSSASPCLR